MNLRSVIYYTKREVQNVILKETGLEDEVNIITNISNNSELNFNSLDNNEFDLI